MAMWIIRNGYVPACTVSQITDYMDGGDLPLAQDVQRIVDSVPLDYNSPIVIADELAAQTELEVFIEAIQNANLANQS